MYASLNQQRNCDIFLQIVFEFRMRDKDQFLNAGFQFVGEHAAASVIIREKNVEQMSLCDKCGTEQSGCDSRICDDKIRIWNVCNQ